MLHKVAFTLSKKRLYHAPYHRFVILYHHLRNIDNVWFGLLWKSYFRTQTDFKWKIWWFVIHCGLKEKKIQFEMFSVKYVSMLWCWAESKGQKFKWFWQKSKNGRTISNKNSTRLLKTAQKSEPIKNIRLPGRASNLKLTRLYISTIY